MALTEIQLPNKAVFYNDLQKIAVDMNELMARWGFAADFLADVDGADMDAMGVPMGQIRTDLVNMRVAINELIAFYEGTSTTQTLPIKDVVDKIRRMFR